MKLFIDAHTFDKEYQGTHGFIKGLYAALHRQFPNVELYAGAHNLDNLRKELPFVPSGNLLAYKKHASGFMRFITDIPSLLKQHQFDFAHFQYTCPAQQSGCQYIVTLHDILFNDFKEDFPLPYRFSRNIFFKKSFKKAAIRTTVSTYSRQRIARHYQLSSDKIHVIPSGPTPGFGEAWSKVEAKKFIAAKYKIENYLLYVSRIEPRKNHQLLLKKFIELRLYEKGISVVFIGKRSIRAVLFEQLLEQLTSEQRKFVHVIEQVMPGDIEAFFRAARAFVYPSRAEGFGLPPLEAALCEIPVLCSSATAMTDYYFFKPWQFDPENETEFGDLLADLVDRPPTQNVLSQIASTIRQRYGWDLTARKFYQLLQQS